MTDIQLLDEQEVSRRLSVSVNTLRYWRVSGDGPNYVKLGRLVRYDAAALENFIGRNCVSQRRERRRRKNVSLTKRGNVWHFAFRWNGKRYRAGCKTSKEQEAKKVESLVLARLLEDGRAPGNKKIPRLADFSNRFFNWLEALPADRPPKAQPVSITESAGGCWNPHPSLV